MENHVLIIGAGPTGLVLALWLTKLGIPVRIIDKDNGPGQTSRAIALHARTLEFYQQIGIADEVVTNGIIIERLNLRNNGQQAASVYLGSLGKNLSPFPFVLSFPQDDHEKLLIRHLQFAGVTVERNTELINLSQNNDKVTAIIKKQHQIETLQTPFLFGCDGARSTVRSSLNINFPGGTYSQLYYVADVMAKGEIANEEIQLCFNENEFTLAFPVRSSGSIRLIGIVPKEIETRKHIQFTDVESRAIQNTKLTISQVNWFSTYHSHHRVANHFKMGRVFLLGDSAHIHSPVGGQGMNTGIGDAINLSWKIALVLKNRASISLLETYESERIVFARRLTETTDKAFQAITNTGLIGKLVRSVFFAFIFPFLTHFTFFKKYLFKTVSQIKINYHHSALSKGKAGTIQGGDRLPWVHGEGVDNFKSLACLDWQIHIYGKATDKFRQSIAPLNLKLNEFSWNKSAAQAGLKKNAIYLIRPDGYVGYANVLQEIEGLENYLSTMLLLLEG
jgi:2-polyprenyl-6-methoxyphenol hydroxylase-like FAD-dependent oxidoreductase